MADCLSELNLTNIFKHFLDKIGAFLKLFTGKGIKIGNTTAHYAVLPFHKREAYNLKNRKQVIFKYLKV